MRAVGRPLAFLPGGCEPVLQRFARLSMVPLRVRCNLATGYLPSEIDRADQPLDSVLAWAVLQALPYPVAFGNQAAAVIPTPLQLLWVSSGEEGIPAGLPLWAATPLRPVTPSALGREYWHRRYPAQRADMSVRIRAKTNAGRWKEFRVPISPRTPCELEALAIGHAGTIIDLLEQVSHLGKLGKTGYGYVARWSVEPVPLTLEEAEQQILATRPVPLAAYGELGGQVAGRIERRGWTPPYWFAPWHASCVVPPLQPPPGPDGVAGPETDPAFTEIDWFEAMREIG
ncbi:MAG: hypothetical protein KatS3mg060_1134 [Dehalococcoidia bacterium]|nr:MAG: hypothetical protein KatS3mg060_1134 [Dehalococcoidia bacterium]